MARYEVQTIDDAEAPAGVHYRITDIVGDNRVATCYVKENADFVCEALNCTVKLLVGARHIEHLRMMADALRAQNPHDTDECIKVMQRAASQLDEINTALASQVPNVIREVNVRFASKLRRLINERESWARADETKGGGDPVGIPHIEEGYRAAKIELELFINTLARQ